MNDRVCPLERPLLVTDCLIPSPTTATPGLAACVDPSLSLGKGPVCAHISIYILDSFGCALPESAPEEDSDKLDDAWSGSDTILISLCHCA